MEQANAKPATVDEYIAQYPAEVRDRLNRVRALIREEAPQAVEKISYSMPGYFLRGAVVWFGAWKRHIALYPVTGAMLEALGDELSAYKQTKGSIHFPLNKPMPYDLIRKIVRVRVAETS